MNRYLFSSIEQPKRILPSQLWIKKAYAPEGIVIVSYIGDDTYECVPMIDKENSIFPNTLGFTTRMQASQISKYYEFSKNL